MPLERYVCHKEVLAAKIVAVERDRLFPSGATGGVLKFPDGDTCPVSDHYLQKHNPQPGGYFVQYEDGYESFSPAGPFEAGYTPIYDRRADAEPS